jgi:hypothetical protein
MKKLFKNIFIFLFICLVIGEFTIRLTHAVSDIPRRTIDDFGMQKYHPNQEGYWSDGKHKWKINSMGWPGKLPKKYNNLVTIIGDSYIENFMNPIECHQANFLEKLIPNYNFIEAGRSGVSFIEAFEISKTFDSLSPKLNLIYVNDNDFYESIEDIKSLSDITQINLNNNKLKFGKLKSPGLKKLLYSWKLAYYFYNRFPLVFTLKKDKKNDNLRGISNDNLNHVRVSKLCNYITKNYDINNKMLVLHPKVDSEITKILNTYGFNYIQLDSSNDKSWEFEYDKHWTCYGHKKVASQVVKSLKQTLN